VQITILGKRYRLLFTRVLGRQDDADVRVPGRTVRVRPDLSDRDTMDAVIHEALHIADWSKEEWWIEGTATDITRILWRLGYRRNP
jgi:hypothetical protein